MHNNDQVFAFEMFAIHRGGKVVQSIICIQRAWREWKKKYMWIQHELFTKNVLFRKLPTGIAQWNIASYLAKNTK